MRLLALHVLTDLLSKYGLNSRNRVWQECVECDMTPGTMICPWPSIPATLHPWISRQYHSGAIIPLSIYVASPSNVTCSCFPCVMQCTHCTVLHCTVLHCTVLYCNVHTNSRGVLHNTRLHLALVHSWGVDVSPKFDPNWIIQTWCPTFPTDRLYSQSNYFPGPIPLDPMFQE